MAAQEKNKQDEQGVYYVQFVKKPFGIMVCAFDQETKKGSFVKKVMDFGDENRKDCKPPSRVIFINDKNVKDKNHDDIIDILKNVQLPFSIGLKKCDKHPWGDQYEQQQK